MNVTPKQLAFAIEQAECSIGNCLGILSATGCIVSEIRALNPAGVIECVSGNKEGVSVDPTPCRMIFMLTAYSFAAAPAASRSSATSSPTTAFATLERVHETDWSTGSP